MGFARATGLILTGSLLALALACGRATGIPADTAGVEDAQHLPFDHSSATDRPAASGAAGRLPVGLPVTIRLQSPLSSATAHPGDVFEATLDDAIELDGQTIAPRGLTLSGRILSAQPAGKRSAGYLRIALVRMTLASGPVAIETSSLFLKGSGHDRGDLPGNAFVAAPREVSIEADRRLTFRLAQAVDLR